MANNRGKNQFSIQDRPYTQKEWLERKYLTEKNSIHLIAVQCGVSDSTIAQWLKKLSIKTRIGNWNGGQFISNTGYRYILAPGHPNGLVKSKNGKSRYVPEHVLVMEKKIGRFLHDKETVHHLNGIKTDNRIENLVLMRSQKEHQALEQKILLFAKQLIWGDKSPKMKEELQRLFKEFSQE